MTKERMIMNEYYVDIEGKTAGPFPLEHVRALYGSGVVSDSTLYCVPGGVEWMPLRVLGPILAAAVPPVPISPPPIMPSHAWQPTVTTQLTSKPLKAVGMLAGLAVVASIMVCLYAPGSGGKAIGLFALLGSVGLLIFVRFLRWWGHA